MKTTSLKEKLLLIILGIFLSVILLEIGLRIAGSVVLYLQERHNHVSFNPNEYRILCLGESTTALGGEDSYPSQLEQMLNAQSQQKKFTVINKGIVSTTTNYILAHVEENLDMYEPQLVIVMMGINDSLFIHALDKALWWENIKSYLQDFRVYKLGQLLYEHITHLIKETSAPVETGDFNKDNFQQVEKFLNFLITDCLERYREHMSMSAKYQQKGQVTLAQEQSQLAKEAAISISLACIELARRDCLLGFFQEAQDVLEKATVLNPNYPGIVQEWGELYLAKARYLEAVKAFQPALALDPKNSNALQGLARAYYQEHNDQAFLIYAGYLQINPWDYSGYIELAQWLRKSKHYDLAQEYLIRAIASGLNFDMAYFVLGQVLDEQGQYRREEEFYLKGISLRPQSPLLYRALGQLYQKQAKEDLSKEYFQKADQWGAEYCPITLVNYNLLLDKILSRHIKVVVMQYPLRDIGFLKDYLRQKNNVIFVENKQNFRQALTKEKYDYYFIDNFSEDFGHCTRVGNELIARNLTEVILTQ